MSDTKGAIILVIGAGKSGLLEHQQLLVDELRTLHHNIVVIDLEKDDIQNLGILFPKKAERVTIDEEAIEKLKSNKFIDTIEPYPIDLNLAMAIKPMPMQYFKKPKKRHRR